MTQYPYSPHMETPVASSMPTMNQGFTVSPGFNVPRDMPSPGALEMNPGNVAGMSPHAVQTMPADVFAPAPFGMAGFNSRNGSDVQIKQQSPQYMHTALPILGHNPTYRINTSVSSTASNQSSMSNMSFGTGLPGVPGSLVGTPMGRSDSSSTEFSPFMQHANLPQASDSEIKRVTSESILAQYVDVTTHLQEDEVKKEKMARKNSAGGCPKRKRSPRNTNLSAEAKEVRKNQNREAQRAYRERKDNTINALKDAVKSLSERASATENKLIDLQRLLKAEKAAHARTRTALANHKASVPTPPMTTPAMQQMMVSGVPNMSPVDQMNMDILTFPDFNTVSVNGFQTGAADFNNPFIGHN